MIERVIERPLIGFLGMLATGSGFAVSRLETVTALFRFGAAAFSCAVGAVTLLWVIWRWRRDWKKFKKWREEQ